MKSKVAIAECRTYRQEPAQRAIETVIELLGGWREFVSPGETILLKPNLLARCTPDKACTTHPQIFAAAARSLQKAGFANLLYGDSPGNHLMGTEQTAEGCGIRQEAEELGVGLADFSRGETIHYPQGHEADHFVLCEGVLSADAIINLCKMKTHQLERITGAVKNTFGCVYGFNKAASHARFPSAESFAKMIADLNLLVKPALHIMDGVIAMEGNGPHSGDPMPMYVVLASADPVALDSVFCHLVDLDPALVPTNVYGQEYGVGTYEEEQIQLLTEEGELSMAEAVAKWGNADFNVERGEEFKGQLSGIRFLQPLLDRKPYVKKQLCVGCGICVQACPVEEKAIYLKNGKPAYRYRKCIKCYCCQEMCPEKAIDVKQSRLARLADRNWKV